MDRPEGLTQEMIDKLDALLDPTLVAKHPHHGFSYLEGYVVINQANIIFGRGNWGYRVVDESENKVGCKATVEFYLFGELMSCDVGFNEFSFSRDAPGVMTGRIYDTAYKGAVTDGMKRAMRMLGAQFGNSLYEKDSTPPKQDAPARAMPQPFGDDVLATDTVCACGKNKRAQYDVCFACNQKRKATQYEPSQPSPPQETGQPPPPPDYDPQDQAGGW